MIKTIRGFMKRLNEDHVGAYAAQSAYFILLSFIPFVLLVVTLVKYTPLTRDDVYSVLINMLPTEFQSYVGGIVNEIFYQSVAYMPITIITTLWSAGKGIAALTNGLNSIYHVTETRNYIINRLRGMAYTLIFAAAFLTSLVLLVFGTRIQNKLTEHLPMVARVTSSIMGMRTLITTGVLAVLFLVLYKCIPNRVVIGILEGDGALDVRRDIQNAAQGSGQALSWSEELRRARVALFLFHAAQPYTAPSLVSLFHGLPPTQCTSSKTSALRRIHLIPLASSSHRTPPLAFIRSRSTYSSWREVPQAVAQRSSFLTFSGSRGMQAGGPNLVTIRP